MNDRPSKRTFKALVVDRAGAEWDITITAVQDYPGKGTVMIEGVYDEDVYTKTIPHDVTDVCSPLRTQSPDVPYRVKFYYGLMMCTADDYAEIDIPYEAIESALVHIETKNL